MNHLTETERLLGRETAVLANRQAANAANNPAVIQRVLKDTDNLIHKGYIDPDSPTARVRRAATEGRWFQELEQNHNGVCMDDVTRFDR